MRISLTQISPEVGASFGLSGPLLELVRDQLNGLGKNIPRFTRIFNGEDYKILFIIVATRKFDTLTIKGPNILKEHNSVEFSFWIPYKNLDFRSRVDYVLAQISRGIIETLSKYKTDEHGIDHAVRQAINTILRHPEKYDDR